MKIHIKPWSQDPGLSDWPWFAWDRGDGRGTGQPPASHWGGGNSGDSPFRHYRSKNLSSALGRKCGKATTPRRGGGPSGPFFSKCLFENEAESALAAGLAKRSWREGSMGSPSVLRCVVGGGPNHPLSPLLEDDPPASGSKTVPRRELRVCSIFVAFLHLFAHFLCIFVISPIFVAFF